MGAQSSAWRVVFVASLAASALIILQTAFDISWLAWARAPLLMPFVFAWTLLTRPRPERRVFAPLLLAQVFSFLGDVLLATPVLAALRSELDETVDLAVLDGPSVRFVEQLPAAHRLRAVSAACSVTHDQIPRISPDPAGMLRHGRPGRLW